MKLYSTETCAQLPPVGKDLTKQIWRAPRTPAAHRELMAHCAALHLIEVAGSTEPARLAETIRVAAWNLERCIDVEGSAALLAQHAPDIVLLSEMDCGMARSGQRHTTQELAERLRMRYAYVVEFHELGLGSGAELERIVDDRNDKGLHGNAILARLPLDQVFLIRLDDHGHWFCDETASDPNQPRIGGRVAVAAVLPTQHGKLCCVSTHLESAGSLARRQSQMDRIIAAVDMFAPNMPTIIGGDLNSGNNIPTHNWRDETLFDAARRHGFSWQNNADGTTTRSSHLTRFPDRAMKLDWFAHRDCICVDAKIVAALDANDEPLSDHELIVGQFNVSRKSPSIPPKT